MPKNALIAGGTGLVGTHLLDLLLESENYDRVVSLVRKPTGRSHPKLKEKLVSFNELKDLVLKTHIEDVYCCLGTTMKKAGSRKKFIHVDLDYPVQLGELGINFGAKRFYVVSAMGANRKSLFFYNRVKGRMEHALMKLKYENIGIFRPSMILGERKEHRSGEEIAKKVTKFVEPLFFGPLKKYKGVHAKQIAESMINYAEKEEKGVRIMESDKIRSGLI